MPRHDGVVPATPGQQRLWFITQLQPGAPTYNEPILVEIRAPVDAQLLQRSIREIVDRHESWRTQFFTERGQVFQRVLSSVEVPLPVVDLTGLPPSERESEALRLAAADARRPFDLNIAPLVRAVLIRMNEDLSWLIVTAHHIVVDGLSYFHVFLPELHAVYTAFAAGRPSPLPALPLQFSDFSLWQTRWLTDETLAPQLTYWQTQLADLQDLDVPTDYARPAHSALAGARYPAALPARLTEGLRALSRRRGVSMFTAVLSAWKVLLYRYADQVDLVVGTAVSGRRRPELNGLIGFFANNLVLRTRIDESMSFSQLLDRVSTVLRDARDNQDVPFERLVAMRDAPRTLNENPLYNTICILMPPAPALPPGWTTRRFDIGTAKVDLYLELHQHPSGLKGHIEYRTDLFDEATIERMAQHLQTLLEDAVDNPDKPVRLLRMLTPGEAELIRSWQEGPAAPALPCLPQLFEAQVERTPNAVAVAFGSETLTYDELNRRANQLAHHLRNLGVGPEVLVGVCVERSFDMIVGVLGIHKAGGAYLPLDPGYPAERLRFMLQDTSASLVLTHTKVQAALPWPRTLWLDNDWPTIAQNPDTNPSPWTKPEHLAYIIYTSGSTGLPKGVEIEHRGITCMASVLRDLLELGVGSRVLQVSSFNFDASVGDISATLTSGAALVLAPRASLIPGPDLARVLREQAITAMELPPSALALVPEGDYPALRSIIAAGEVCSNDVVARWAPGRRFFNGYGPTETTVYSTFAECKDPSEILPIGRPNAGVQVYILDRAMQPVPVGVPGEVYIGGIGLGRGYLRRPELTAERFCQNPFVGGGQRLYRTGDRARYRLDGSIVYLGRTDRQIKLRGFRIELGEIEALLSRHPDVAEAAVVLREELPGDKRLAAYVVPRQPATAETSTTLTQWVKSQLPEHMVPSSLTLLERLPLSPNGKLNRDALPAPEQQRSAAAYEPPRTEVEHIIVDTWRDVLRREHVGVHDNFFDLGGHSLLLAEVLARLQARLRSEVTMLDLFQYPTVRELAARLSPAHPSAPPSAADSLLAPSRERARRQRAVLGLSHGEQPPRAAGAAGVAIIGMAGRFPGAPDVQTFYRNLREGIESIKFFSEAELEAAGLDPALFCDPSYVAASGFLADIELFDAPFFGILPREAEIMDPQQRLFLECAWEALEDAGYDPRRYARPIGVFAGAGSNGYLQRNIAAHPGVREAVGDYHLNLATDKDYLSTRASYKLDLRGPSLTIQAACATSLVAVSTAYLALLTQQCDVALAGGVSVHLEGRYGYKYREGMIFSPDGRCRAFDAAAQGTVGGDGVGVVVLKRLEDALADGDHIYAVIRGAAVNNDGSSKVGYTAPSVVGQAQVVAHALALADVAPESIAYIEAHGTGTPLGDPIELAALREVFRGCPPGSIAIGSVKPNVGHLNTAAGVAGLIKAVLALNHGELLPTLHFSRPNPKLEIEQSPFYVNTRLTSWSSNGPRRAGVSAFGVGGTNAHVVLEEAPPPPDKSCTGGRTRQLLALSARSAAALDAATRKLAGCLRARPELPLADVAYTLQVGRRAFDYRRAVVCDTTERAALALTEPGDIETHTDIVERRPVAFLFPGQGSQYPNMGREVYQSEPTFRSWVDQCSELLLPSLGRDVREILFPSASEIEDAEAELRRTALAQPALFVVEYALAQLWMEWGLRPQAMLGHSIGEYVAACLADVFELPDALWLVAERGRLMQSLPAGAMLAVPHPEAEARTLCGEALSIAAVNGPALTVLAGPGEDIAAVERRLAERGISGVRLRTSHAFHSSMMDPILPAFERCVARVTRRAPKIPYISNVTGTWVEAQHVTSPAYWARHLGETVRLSAGLEVLLRTPERALLEVGPGDGLSALVRRQAGRSAGLQVSSSLPARSYRGSAGEFLLAALGKMWQSGVEVDWDGHHAHARPRRVSLPTYPFERRRYWLDPGRAAVRTEEASRGASPGAGRGDAPNRGEADRLPGAPAASPRGGDPARSVAHTRPPLKQPYVPPASDLERKLAEIWTTSLGIEPAGRNDDFFELGGDSFIAVQLLARISAELRLDLAAHDLLRSPTIAALARDIEGRTRTADTSEEARPPRHTPLIELKRGSSRTSLFLVHPVGGHVYVYRDLASYLGPEIGVYALQAQGLDGRAEPLNSIAEMAVQYVGAVRACQPEGPYYLGGASFGGLVAYEMARVLQTQRQEVAFVAMMDTAGPGDLPAPLESDTEILAYLISIGALDPAFAAEIRDLAPEEQLARFVRSTGQATRIVAPMPNAQMRHFLDMWRVGMKTMTEYAPAPSRCPVVFLRATERDAVNSPTPERGWRDILLGKFDVYDVPGNHITMNYSPNVKQIADILTAHMRKT